MKVQRMSVKKLVTLSIMVAIAVVVNIVESFIPIVPGTAFKIGFANIITLIVAYAYGPKEAIAVGLLRIFIGGLLSPSGFGPTFMLSFTGGLFSIIAVVVLRIINKNGLIAVSMVSSVMHVVGQILAASFLLTDVVAYYAPIMLVLSVPAGILTGFLADRFLKVTEGWFQEKKY
ncbi:MAG: Gx transporter family protein [Acholeplasmataceae bacterium]|nr:Gx transporter family protein [Acholeplasmataceae bacterium]MDD4203609.1 Gx transporter family protein [Acholeplasmataceae bacterium]MDD4468914.1 Gx transporter family protein [Acholeplasmataceae bacterium]MDD4824501.1 Gx transporter family protein [Acholeplasmataceae bacterium]